MGLELLQQSATIWIALGGGKIVAAKDKEHALEMFKRLLDRSPEQLMSIPYFPQVDGAGNKIVLPKVQ